MRYHSGHNRARDVFRGHCANRADYQIKHELTSGRNQQAKVPGYALSEFEATLTGLAIEGVEIAKRQIVRPLLRIRFAVMLNALSAIRRRCV